MLSFDPMPECRKPCLWFVESSVPPAREKYSPPDKLVGIVISGTVGCFTSDGMSVLSTEYRASCFDSLISFAKHWRVSSRATLIGRKSSPAQQASHHQSDSQRPK